jgi:hypothetical protein
MNLLKIFSRNQSGIAFSILHEITGNTSPSKGRSLNDIKWECGTGNQQG